MINIIVVIVIFAAAAAKSLQLCPTLCDPIDGSPPGSAFPRILQARTLEWVSIAFSIVWKWKVKVKSLSCVRLVATPWTQPTRLLHPWDFLGKSTAVACHYWLIKINLQLWTHLKQRIKNKHKLAFVLSRSVVWSYSTLFDPLDCSLPGSSVWDFSRQEYWNRLAFPSPGDLPDPGIKTWA